MKCQHCNNPPYKDHYTCLSCWRNTSPLKWKKSWRELFQELLKPINPITKGNCDDRLPRYIDDK